MAIEVGDFLERTTDHVLFRVVELVKYHSAEAASGIGYEYVLRTRDEGEEVKLDSFEHLRNDWYRAVDSSDDRCW